MNFIYKFPPRESGGEAGTEEELVHNLLTMACSHSLLFFVAFFLFAFTVIPSSRSLPFVVFHGINDECVSHNVTHFTSSLSTWSNAPGKCIEIGNGIQDSWFVPLEKQAIEACQKVKALNELKAGYNIVAISQGNMVARGVIEFCDGGPPVHNYISVAGPHAGIINVPFCEKLDICKYVLNFGVYNPIVQDHIAPSNFIKIPTKIKDYRAACHYLPKLNNEFPETYNSTYKERFSSLKNLVLIKFKGENVLLPAESSWFGFYQDGSSENLLPTKETALYREDWIGLRSLDEAKRVKYVEVEGLHPDISDEDMKRYIVPYLKEKKKEEEEEEYSPSPEQISAI